MKIQNWVKFEKPGEREQLRTIINSSDDKLEAISKIASTFEMDLVDATNAYNIFKERITHD